MTDFEKMILKHVQNFCDQSSDRLYQYLKNLDRGTTLPHSANMQEYIEGSFTEFWKRQGVVRIDTTPCNDGEGFSWSDLINGLDRSTERSVTVSKTDTSKGVTVFDSPAIRQG